MKFLGLVKDPKDLTTKEYVDNADKELKEATESSIAALDEGKINSEDLQELSDDEILDVWDSVFTPATE